MNELIKEAALVLKDAALFSRFEDCEDDYKFCLSEYNNLINKMKEADNR